MHGATFFRLVARCVQHDKAENSVISLNIQGIKVKIEVSDRENSILG